MKQLIIVAVGGGLGAVLRWALGGLILHQTAAWKFPLSTLVINVLGCVLAGVLAGLITKLDIFTTDTRLLLFTGVLGGFTTFSAFGLDTVVLLRRGDYAVAMVYVLATVLAGVAGLWLAIIAVERGV